MLQAKLNFLFHNIIKLLSVSSVCGFSGRSSLLNKFLSCIVQNCVRPGLGPYVTMSHGHIYIATSASKTPIPQYNLSA